MITCQAFYADIIGICNDPTIIWIHPGIIWNIIWTTWYPLVSSGWYTPISSSKIIHGSNHPIRICCIVPPQSILVAWRNPACFCIHFFCSLIDTLPWWLMKGIVFQADNNCLAITTCILKIWPAMVLIIVEFHKSSTYFNYIRPEW